MTAILALFVRSLQQSVRQPGTYWLRAAFAAGVLFMWWIVQQHMAYAGAPGRAAFQLIIVLNYMVVILASCSFFVQAIGEEKEENTLGLLRMTNLSPLSILLGKAAGRLFIALLILVT